ncbi:MAG TPA: phage tail tube protein [Pirellulales bacterium]|nr:phage tail tube protein [Pirellulales bacterium]
MTATNAFLGNQALFGAVPETTYGVTPGAGNIGALTSAYVFTGETLAKHGNVVERLGLRGTRSHVADDARSGPYQVGGSVVLEPTPIDLLFWLEYILGGTPSGGSYTLAETLPSATLGFARGPKNFRYAGCAVDKATFSGSAGGLLRLVLEIAGQSETLETTAWPSITADTTGPYIFSDLALTINGAAREVRSFELVIDNALVKNRFMNSTTVVNLPAGDRVVSLTTTHAWASANADLYDPPIGGYAGASLEFAAGAHSTAFTFGCLQAPALSPTAERRQENYLSIHWTVRQTGSTKELSVVSS